MSRETHKDWETFLFKDGLMVTTNSQIKWGWSEQAELWNGRLAMLGFVIAIATEFLTGVQVSWVNCVGSCRTRSALRL